MSCILRGLSIQIVIKLQSFKFKSKQWNLFPISNVHFIKQLISRWSYWLQYKFPKVGIANVGWSRILPATAVSGITFYRRGAIKRRVAFIQIKSISKNQFLSGFITHTYIFQTTISKIVVL